MTVPSRSAAKRRPSSETRTRAALRPCVSMVRRSCPCGKFHCLIWRSLQNAARDLLFLAIKRSSTSDVVERVETSTIGGGVCASAKLNTHSTVTTSMRILQPVQHNRKTYCSVHILRIASESDRPDQLTAGDDGVRSVIFVRASFKSGLTGECHLRHWGRRRAGGLGEGRWFGHCDDRGRGVRRRKMVRPRKENPRGHT